MLVALIKLTPFLQIRGKEKQLVKYSPLWGKKTNVPPLFFAFLPFKTGNS